MKFVRLLLEPNFILIRILMPDCNLHRPGNLRIHGSPLFILRCRTFPAFCRRMSKSVLYANGGGSLIQDVTSHRSLWFYLFTLSAARRLGCKVMMYGCGIGPIQSPRNRRRAGRIINRNVDAITLRDHASLDELAALGVDRPRIQVAADPAVSLPAAPAEEAEAVLEQAGLRPREGQRYLGVTVRPWPGLEDKLDVFAQAIDHAYEKHHLLPVFLPIEGTKDVAAAKEVAARLKRAPAVILPPCPTSELAIALSARMDVALSMRLHALIFAAVCRVPLVGVVYDPKVSAFLDDAGQDLYVQLDQVTPELLRALLDAAAQVLQIVMVAALCGVVYRVCGFRGLRVRFLAAEMARSAWRTQRRSSSFAGK